MDNLFFSLVAGAIGAGYILYGMRQKKLVAVMAGVFLGLYPYFVDSGLWLGVIGAILMAAPFVIDF
jgi:hypothetical protein